VDGLTIVDNDLQTGTKRGIRVVTDTSVNVGTNSNVEAHLNNIVGFAYAGLEVDPGGHVGPVDATCNWWGSTTGPTNPGNPGGTGDKVIGGAIFTPWLTAPAPNGPCLGAPNTPGKVTGGGQILGDPTFSSLGTLLSAPAVIPSLVDPKVQATFGFVAKCCAPSGNLEFSDHQADVRIKAQSIDGLFITTGPCGANTHAVFTGTAAVIRSTGTVNESFFVEVDDCSEPGSSPGTGPDTFSITATGTAPYASGPQPLIGGNIQIHKS